MPGLVFPFVKMHAAGSTAASNESCFELLATVLINWTRGGLLVFLRILLMPRLYPICALTDNAPHLLLLVACCSESSCISVFPVGWFERFPDPPLGILARLDALLTFHDAPLVGGSYQRFHTTMLAHLELHEPRLALLALWITNLFC